MTVSMGPGGKGVNGLTLGSADRTMSEVILVARPRKEAHCSAEPVPTALRVAVGPIPGAFAGAEQWREAAPADHGMLAHLLC